MPGDDLARLLRGAAALIAIHDALEANRHAGNGIRRQVAVGHADADGREPLSSGQVLLVAARLQQLHAAGGADRVNIEDVARGLRRNAHAGAHPDFGGEVGDRKGGAGFAGGIGGDGGWGERAGTEHDLEFHQASRKRGAVSDHPRQQRHRGGGVGRDIDLGRRRRDHQRAADAVDRGRSRLPVGERCGNRGCARGFHQNPDVGFAGAVGGDDARGGVARQQRHRRARRGEGDRRAGDGRDAVGGDDPHAKWIGRLDADRDRRIGAEQQLQRCRRRRRRR